MGWISGARVSRWRHQCDEQLVGARRERQRDLVGAFLPWTRRYTTITAIRPVRNILLLPVLVDGQVLLAELDSGSSSSVVIAPGIERLRLTAGGDGTLRGAAKT